MTNDSYQPKSREITLKGVVARTILFVCRPIESLIWWAANAKLDAEFARIKKQKMVEGEQK